MDSKVVKEVAIWIGVAALVCAGLSYPPIGAKVSQLFNNTRHAITSPKQDIKVLRKLELSTIDALAELFENDARSSVAVNHSMVGVYSEEEKRPYAGIMLTTDGLILTTTYATTAFSGKDFSRIYVVDNTGQTYKTGEVRIPCEIIAKDPVNLLALVYVPIGMIAEPAPVPLYRGEILGKEVVLIQSNGQITYTQPAEVVETGISNIMFGNSFGNNLFELKLQVPSEKVDTGFVTIKDNNEDKLAGIIVSQLVEKNSEGNARETRVLAAGIDQIEALAKMAIQYSKQ
ncbi:MAG: hypothetical protein V1702_01310 [Candidatus Woesearchaeota archaeon]